jgi:LmbE family N-acetylglucosaminyl deacetylase
MIHDILRGAGRRLLGPTWFDSLVQFRRVPRTDPVLAAARQSRCVFVEPHFDDVAFSCGGILAALAEAGAPLDLITVFTAGPDAEASLSVLAREVHAQWAAEEPPYDLRRREARRIEERIDVRRKELGLQEVLYRDAALTAEDGLFQRGGEDEETVAHAVERRLAEAVGDDARTLFAPLGVGGHRDHRVVHAAVRALASRRPDWAVWYYEDFPYTLDVDALKERVRRLGPGLRPATVDVTATVDERVRLSAAYDSQVRAIFGTPGRLRKEILGYAGRVGTPRRPRERVWALSSP